VTPDLLDAPRPFPAFARPMGRLLLRTWSRFPKAPGYLYKTVERWGSRLAVEPIECRLFTGARVTCDLREHVQRQMYFFGAYEPILAHLFRSLLRPGMVVVDAGAHVGQYTLVAADAVGDAGQVHAFEPVQANFDRLAEHVRSNSRSPAVRVNRLALWHENGPLDLHYGPDVRLNAGTYTTGRLVDEAGAVRCQAARLDDYVAEQAVPRIDLIKMDIQGAELRALQGAAEVLSRWRPIMLMEVNRTVCRGNGYEPERIWDLLAPHGYRAFAVGHSTGTSRALASLDGVDDANIIFHVDPLPGTIVTGWSEKGILRSCRRAHF
jgi:FkbM family methyltransferase